MKSEEIKAEINEITSKLEQVANEVQAKKAEIATLKDLNAKLNMQNLGKERKAPSIHINRKRINLLSDQVEELEFVRRNLDQSLKFSKEKLQEASFVDKIQGYKMVEAAHLECYNRVQSLYSELVGAVAALEKIQSGHCLARLTELAAAIGTEKLSKCGVDVNQVLAKFGKIDLPADLDGARMHSLQVNLRNHTSQLKAIAKGERTFSQVKIKRSTPAPNVSAITNARNFEKARLSNRDLLARAQKNRKTIIHRPVV